MLRINYIAMQLICEVIEKGWIWEYTIIKKGRLISIYLLIIMFKQLWI